MASMSTSRVSVREALRRAPCLAAIALSGCGAPEDTASGACPTVTSVSAVSAEARALLGLASRYPADTMMASRYEEIRRSQRARRAAAWEVVARVLAPVRVETPAPLIDATVPRFRTWYDRDDVVRVFQRAFEQLGPELRRAHGPFPKRCSTRPSGGTPASSTPSTSGPPLAGAPTSARSTTGPPSLAPLESAGSP